jgi:tRNA A-37 threonylcarbamoyl transferase component Bud32
MKYKILDYGHDGIIVYPGILNDDKNINKYITKIGMKKNIDNEKYIYDNLPDEFDKIIYNKECYINTFESKLLNDFDLTEINSKRKTKLTEYNRQITINFFNGKNLAKILQNRSMITKPEIYNLLKKMIFLYECIKKLNNKYFIFHKDITRHNILYNQEKNKIFLIDFVQSKKFPIGTFPDYLPNKDLTDMIDVINNIVEFITKEKYINLIPIKTIEELEMNMKYIKNELLK